MRNTETHRYQEYATAICLTLGLLPWSAIHRTVEILQVARLADNQVLIVGSNGGQVAADHIALTLNKVAEMSGRPDAFVSVQVGCDSSDNAETYASSHAEVTIDELARTLAPGDVVVVVACSPATSCYRTTLEMARGRGAITMIWAYGNCEELLQLVDVAIVIPNDRPDQVELTYDVVAFMVADALHALELS